MKDQGVRRFARAAEQIAESSSRIANALERIAAVFEATDNADMSPAQPEVGGVQVADD